jgi:hypothetical protein
MDLGIVVIGQQIIEAHFEQHENLNLTFGTTRLTNLEALTKQTSSEYPYDIELIQSSNSVVRFMGYLANWKVDYDKGSVMFILQQTGPLMSAASMADSHKSISFAPTEHSLAYDGVAVGGGENITAGSTF